MAVAICAAAPMWQQYGMAIWQYKQYVYNHNNGHVYGIIAICGQHGNIA